MAKVVRLSNAIEEISLTAANALAYRRVLGVEKKNRARVSVMVEEEFLERFRGAPRGALSDAINMGLNIVLVQRGML
ncbi:MAG: hypothetical protein PHQ24_11920 [Proteiniphilum sp.]|nr:hypothetical protein [Proteiniphilum sp.]